MSAEVDVVVGLIATCLLDADGRAEGMIKTG